MYVGSTYIFPLVEVDNEPNLYSWLYKYMYVLGLGNTNRYVVVLMGVKRSPTFQKTQQ